MDKIDSSPDIRLSFSTDTVFFDTVFPTVGSVTKRLIVYNQHNNKVLISDIRLMGGQNSEYRVNVDGHPEINVTDVEIPANDSLYVFIRVTVDPNNENTPFVVSDSLEFQINGNIQKVKLVAWGQNALFYHKTKISGNIIWDSLKAHVIYGSLRIDTNAILTILPGTKVYFHQRSYIAASYQSSLKVLGTIDHPVRFQGDRLDFFYKDLPGQWDGIYLEQGSRDHEFNYAIIKNGSFGFAVDSLGNNTNPMLVIDNTIIQNMTYDGIYAYGSSIRSTNCVIGNCGGTALDIVFGGMYDFRQLTVGNFWSSSVRLSSSIYLSNYSYDTTGQKITNPLSSAYFGNTIIYGSNDDEIKMDSVIDVPFKFTFDHGLLKTRLNTSDPGRYIQCMINKDPRFLDGLKMDYRIDSLSPAINKGINMGVPLDILGVERGNTPDLGAYQFAR
ncbi:MAG: hypothetical protein WCI71_18595 [Bacteroidota bacterium]